MPVNDNRTIELIEIVGEQLSAVTFVQDYIQLHFDGPIVTAVTLPYVQSDGKTIRPEDAGYRDALCGLITRQVKAASIVPGKQALIELAGGSSIVVPLTPESYSPAGEAIIVIDAKGRTWGVW